MSGLKSPWLFIFILLTTVYIRSTHAINLSSLLPSQWYWYLHITPQNQIRLISLINLNHPEGATNADTSFHFYYPSAPLEATSSIQMTSIMLGNWNQQNKKQLVIESKLFSTLYRIGNGYEHTRVSIRGRLNFAEIANPPYSSFIFSSIVGILMFPSLIPAIWLYFRPPVHGTQGVLEQHIESGVTIQSGASALTYPIHRSDSQSFLINNMRANIGRLISIYEYSRGAIDTHTDSQLPPQNIESLIGQMRSLRYAGLVRRPGHHQYVEQCSKSHNHIGGALSREAGTDQKGISGQEKRKLTCDTLIQKSRKPNKNKEFRLKLGGPSRTRTWDQRIMSLESTSVQIAS